MRSAGANQAISAASRCTASASAQMIATSCPCVAASVAHCASASASAEPATTGIEALRPGGGKAGSRRGSVGETAMGNEDSNAEDTDKDAIIRCRRYVAVSLAGVLAILSQGS